MVKLVRVGQKVWLDDGLQLPDVNPKPRFAPDGRDFWCVAIMPLYFARLAAKMRYEKEYGFLRFRTYAGSPFPFDFCQLTAEK